MLRGQKRKPRPEPLGPPPEVGDEAVVRYGLYKLTCQVVQVSRAGRYVKVEVDPNQVPVGSEGAVYVFTRQDNGSYQRKVPGYMPWILKLGVETARCLSRDTN